MVGPCPISSGFGQVTPVPASPALNGASVRGLIYYAVEHRALQQVVERGTAGANGVAFERLFLAPDTRYRIWLLEATSLRVSEVTFTSGGIGQTLNLPPFVFHEQSSHDADQDGLPDLGEFILGTNAREPDTDGDGIRDGPEVRQGTDPLNGLAVRTGIIATAPINGTAEDIVAANDLAVVASPDRGVSVFNIFNGMNPVVIAQVDLPGQPRRVALSGNLVAVACGTAGLAVIDIEDPPAARVIRQIHLGVATSVAVAGPVAFYGSSGQVFAVDMPSGATLGSVYDLPGTVEDLVLSGEEVYAITANKVHVLSLRDGAFERVASVDSPVASSGATRVVAGGGILYVVHNRGYNTFDLTDPTGPILLQAGVTPQFGWRQVAPNGSGLAVAAVNDFQGSIGPEDVSLYNVADASQVNEFMTRFVTPGQARSVTIYNGLAYVADSPAGLQVINYLAYDSQGRAPSIRLAPAFPLNPPRVDEAKLTSIEVVVTDDVQVRNVEFYLDGESVGTDGNFPFELRFLTPRRQAGKNSFSLRARASDTGGNSAWSEELVVNLAEDGTPPRVRRVDPVGGSLAAPRNTVVAIFSEPMDPDTLSTGSFTLVRAGADGSAGTADDQPVAGGTVSYRDSIHAAVLVVPAELAPGLYEAVIRPPAADRAGNVISTPFIWSFRIYSPQDNDSDGLPDELEPSLGLDPTKADTDNDGVPDHLEDFDNDGLPNAAEILFATDPTRGDSDGDGFRDGEEDEDTDGLSAAVEYRLGTQPLSADTDADGWSDGAEFAGLSDPHDANSRPIKGHAAAPPLSLVLPRAQPGLVRASTVAQPPVSIVLPKAQPGLARATTVARPPVSLVLAGQQPGVSRGGVVAQPTVKITIPANSPPFLP